MCIVPCLSCPASVPFVAHVLLHAWDLHASHMRSRCDSCVCEICVCACGYPHLQYPVGWSWKGGRLAHTLGLCSFFATNKLQCSCTSFRHACTLRDRTQQSLHSANSSSTSWVDGMHEGSLADCQGASTCRAVKTCLFVAV